MTSARIPLVAVVGPTAVGKTALAIELARRFGGEIINADSRQIYTGMDIGTAKPTANELAAAQHHLIDIRNPHQSFSLGEYLPLATEAVADTHRRGRLPIVCGGTGQFVWALLEGWQVPAVPPDLAYRAELERRAESEGIDALWQELRALDRERAEAVDRNNARRVMRALEIVRATGSRIAGAARSAEPPYRATIIGLTAERSVLYDRIDRRFDAMMDAGFLDEVERLLADGHESGDGPLSSVGYGQLTEYLAGNLTLNEAVERAKFHTHRLVRRQYTWFKPSDERITWLDATCSLPVTEAARLVANFRSE